MANIVDSEKAFLLEAGPSSSLSPVCPEATQGGKRGLTTTLIPLLFGLGVFLCLTKSAGFFSPVTGPASFSATLSGAGLDDICPRPALEGKPSNWTELYNYAEFAEESASRLAGAVRIPTQ